MKRKLSDTFISNLRNGMLKELLSYVISDNTLDIGIRENYINIYYRGGSALKVTEKNTNNYKFYFDEKYLKAANFLSIGIINGYKSNSQWSNYFPLVKQAMDLYFTIHGKEEREYQQLVVRENNYSSIANSTDYFILDIEYDNHKNARFDIVAIEWLSTPSARKLQKGYKPKLAIIEMKYADGALKGKAGINKHIADFNKFTSNVQIVNDFKDEMLEVFSQKLKLGTIPCLLRKSNPYLEWEENRVINPQFDDDIDMMFLIANHDPAKSVLDEELKSLKNKEIKFFASNFMGYGLFKEKLYNYE